jgi:dihydroorotase
MRRAGLGTLAPGCIGDAAILSIEEGEFDYVDTTGERLRGTRRLALHGMVVAGKWWHPDTGSA